MAFCLLWVLSGCATPVSRQWLDSRTAVTVTAQDQPVVLAREDFPAGVNVRDYAELGVFDVNRSGDHHRYVALVLWSTVDRSAAELAAQDQAFGKVVLWVDDQPMSLQRAADDAQNSLLSTAVFRLPSPNAREVYYEVTARQWQALGGAQHLSLTPSTAAQGERAYTVWRGSPAQLRAFIAAVPAE